MRKFFFILSALMLLWRAETTSAASLDDFKGIWIFSPKETHAFLVETKSPFLAEFDQQKFGDTEELRLRIDMANKYLSFIFVKEPHCCLIDFSTVEIAERRCVVLMGV